MDQGLKLRLAIEMGETHSSDEICHLLGESKLVGRLTKDFIPHPLFATFRLMGISEIPYIETLPYTQKLLSYIEENISVSEGFSPLGGVEELVPCYNALIFEAYCRLGLSDSKSAQAALSWIKQYQLFARDEITSWPHDGVCKHGGCLGKIPCYIGIGKTVRALITYSKSTNHNDSEVEQLIEIGTNYMLRHNFFQRLTDKKAISAHITDIMMPQSYALSLTDLVYIAGEGNLLGEPGSQALFALLKEKEIASHQWKIDYIYSYKGYVSFEGRRKASEWISNLFPIWLGEKKT
ncbi:MAG: hypothetical protein ACRC3H_00860 [Lachnospiraceae bacterium]